MANNKELLYVCVLIFLCASVNECRKEIRKFEIQALVPRPTDTDCDVRKLGAVPFSCNRPLRRFQTESHALCHIPGNGTVLEYKCVDGAWKLSTGTNHEIGYNLRNERGLLGAIVGIAKAVVAVVTLVKIIYCTEKYGNTQCEKREVDSVNLVPPEYTTCPPADIQPLYTAERGHKSVSVSWTDPAASDDEDVISNEQTCCGYTKGSEFPGLPGPGWRHTVTYTTKDNYGLSDTCSFSFTVKYLTCGEPETPLFGRKVSCPDGYIYGGECTFECYPGFEMVGSNTATCQEDETWDSSPTCQKTACEAPFVLPNGQLECDDDTSYLFDDDCYFVCNDGFDLNGPRRMSCKADKTWSVDASQVSCEDDESPVINCQSPQKVYTDRGSFETAGTWIEPTATDNVDLNPSITQQFGPKQGQTLSEGFHDVVYKAMDSDGNSHPALSECTIRIEVKVIKCSTGPTDALDVSGFMTYTCSDTTFYNGVSCTLGCDLNLPLNGTDLMTCERDGTTDQGVWSWGSGYQPSCEVVECPSLDAPENGAYTNDSVNARPLHVMFCREGYDISSVGSVFQGRLSCQDSGEWYPLLKFPGCIVSILPWLNLPAELYYEGDCNDEATTDQIKLQVLDYLSDVQADIDSSICPAVDTCKIENVNVVCGTSSGRKRRSNQHSVAKRQIGFAQVMFGIRVLFDPGNKTTQDEYIEQLDILNDMKALVQVSVDNGDLDILGLTLSSDGFQTDDSPGLQCDPGYSINTGSVICKPCPRGTYLNSSTGICEYCHIGEYMDHDGAMTCDSCPANHSTLNEGSKSVDKCLPLCSPGTFSSTQMEPCSACTVGTYQSFRGQMGCLSCPFGTATNKTGAISVDECDYFDISVDNLSQRTSIGQFSAGGTNTLSASVWLKLNGNDVPDMSIIVSDSVFVDILTIKASGMLYVGSDASSLVETPNVLSWERWTHIVCGIDVASGAVDAYVDGTLVVSEAGYTTDPSRTVSDGHVGIVSNSNGMYISGLVIYDRQLSSDDRMSLSQTCAVAASDDIFSMDGILPNIVEGIAVISPTSCDPVDECMDDPCGNHTCVNKVNDFECICHGGMTGDHCDIPPDYCQGHECVHGNCIPETGKYKCDCSDGYTGVFCDTPPVNGNWSQWAEWTGCSVTCGGGTRSRTRGCTNPPPAAMGIDCDGTGVENDSCNEETCPSCPQLGRRKGTVVTCTQNEAENQQECNMTCLTGSELPNGQRPFEKYWCGPSTNYEWNPIDKLPPCVSDIKQPDIFGTEASVDYTATIAASDTAAVEASVAQQASAAGCAQSGLCTVTASVSNSSRKKRSTGSSVTLQFAITLTESGDLGIADYLANGTETVAMTELLDALSAISEAIEFVENNTQSIFQTTVGGVEYTLENDSASIVATVTCPTGYAGAGGLCAMCPAGTKLVGFECQDCEVGTYQPESGQSSCLPCPMGYTTPTYGATNISECSVISHTSTTTDPGDDDDDDDDDDGDDGDDDGDDGDSVGDDKESSNVVMIVLIVLSVVACILSVIAISVVLWKKVVRRRFRRNDIHGSFASISMVRTESSLSNNDEVGKSNFNARVIKHPITHTSCPHNLPPISGATCLDDPPAYDSHGFDATPPTATKGAWSVFKSEKLRMKDK